MFPADAGMNREQGKQVNAAGSVPRRRGDEPGNITIWINDDVCSPQTRG